MNAADIITTILLLIIIAPIIGTMVPTGSVRFMTVMGNSMEPTITASDIIIVTPTDTDQLAVGDVIAFRHKFDNALYPVTITHRIVGLANEGYRTKGDAYTDADDYVVAPEEVIGIMRFKFPFLGALVHFADTGAGLVTLVLVPALVIIALEVRKIIEHRRVSA